LARCQERVDLDPAAREGPAQREDTGAAGDQNLGAQPELIHEESIGGPDRELKANEKAMAGAAERT
jgi:hypothetical protein